MSAVQIGQSTLVHSLATLLRNDGDSVLDGTSTLTLQASCVQHLTRLFEQYLLPRTRQHGFLALPSHPADTTSLLQIQFLFDMLQKTISLKVVRPPGARLESVVKIFPFKSLKQLELKRIPPHCLEGLRGVYSQLEIFICSKSLNYLQELLSLCGGDLSSALPWLELHTLNFSYNSISCLDESLSLLNVLKSLDLSHNRIKDCAEYLKPLGELEHLNLAYNNLQKVPVLSLSTRTRLVSLVLRNNELERINGVEFLTSLQHLDLAYNLLMEHSQLAPLFLLHSLKTLTLEGNPLYFQKTHRLSTACHLSPGAALHRLKLDGLALSSSELAVLQKPREPKSQTCQTEQVIMAFEQTVNEASSGAGEMSDSLSVNESGASRVTRRKFKNKVKVRTASISELSDTDHEPKPASFQEVILHHQKDIERMDSFREQLGEDWLRFKHHLDGASALVPDSSVGRVTVEVMTECPSPPPNKDNCPTSTLDSLPAPVLSSELKKDDEESIDLQPDTESTLQWTGHSPVDTESTLETSVGELQAPERDFTEAAPADLEDDDLGVDLCRPMLVGVLSDTEEPDGSKTSKPLFLRVHQAYILEVDLQGKVRSHLELECLREVIATQATWTEKGKNKSHPSLKLHFSYVSKERQKRQYIILDDDPQEALQALSEVLAKVVEENERQATKGKNENARLQCLKCHAVFTQLSSKSRMKSLTEIDGYHQYQEGEKEYCPGEAVFCPECNTDHVVQLVGQSAPSTSTPVSCGIGQNEEGCFIFDDIDSARHLQKEVSSLSQVSPLNMTKSLEFATLPEEATDLFLTAHSSHVNILSDQAEGWPNHQINFHSTELQADVDPEGPTNELPGGTSGLQSLQIHQSPQSTQRHSLDTCTVGLHDLLSEDIETMDHRLKLFLDVEVFEENEEVHCFLKMSVVKFGNPVEFLSLLVVSDQCIYFLEMTSKLDGQPSDWLQKRDSHRLNELSYLEIGLGSQSIHMEFGDGAAAYTLLVRDSARCKNFFSRLTGIARDLAPKCNSKLKGISTTRLNPRHHLWPLVCHSSKVGIEEDSHPPFFYLLAFLDLGGTLASVTVLATQEMLCLLDEDHQWSKSCSNFTANEDCQTSSGKSSIRETQPISCVSSISLFSSNPCRVAIKLFDEMAKEEKTWPLIAEAGQEIQDLVDWIKSQWEAMFGVKLITAVC